MKTKKILLGLLAVICIGVSTLGLTSCGEKHYCDYCGDDAIWRATETFLGEPLGDDPHTYVCAECKRDGKGPKPFTGCTIEWDRI